MAEYIYKPHEHIQSVAAAVWTVQHNLRRWTTVTIWDEAGKRIGGEVSRVDDNTITISFFEKGSPKALKGRVTVG